VHCIANARVSAFFYRFRRDVLGMDEAQARAEMEAVWQPAPGLRPIYAPDYYAAFISDPDGYRIEAYYGPGET